MPIHRPGPSFFIQVALAVAACQLPLARPAIAARRQPNVIVVLVDDQGYGDLGVHGNPRVHTPHLDRLHAQSVRFTDFHVSPMCTPTRGQLLTGTDALRNGAMNVSSGRSMLRTDFPTMADAFRQAGYRTAMFGKWHLGDNHPYRPQDRGFEEAVTFRSSYISSAADHWNNDYFDDTFLHNGVSTPYRGFCTDVFFTEAKTWIRERAQARERFFLYLPLNAAHAPFFAPTKDRARYANEKHDLAGFYGMLSNLDDNLAALDELLKEQAIFDDTLLVYLTDNGTSKGAEVFNAGMRGAKTSLYEGGHRVPLFMRWPHGAFAPPGDVTALTHVQDLFPTLINLAGVPKPQGASFDGASLAPLLRNPRAPWADRTLFVQYSRMDHPPPVEGNATVMWRRFRLVDQTELYDLQSDPGQKRDLAADRPDVVRRLRAAYQTWWRGVAPSINRYGLPLVGSDAEPVSVLTPADWHDRFLDQSTQVRNGMRENGAWFVRVDRPATYRFSLRRWPVEAGAGLQEGVPEYRATDGIYARGVALPIHAARIEVGGVTQRQVVRAGATEVAFELPLQPGPLKIKTWFEDKSGQELAGAYYVYVQRL